MRGTVRLILDYCYVIDGYDKQFCHYTQTENIKHFAQLVMSE
jgi:hypothetical protein